MKPSAKQIFALTCIKTNESRILLQVLNEGVPFFNAPKPRDWYLHLLEVIRVEAEQIRQN